MTPIEFPDEWAQQAIECPSCKQSTFLAVVKSEPDPAQPARLQFSLFRLPMRQRTRFRLAVRVGSMEG